MRFGGVESGADNVFGAKWQFIKAWDRTGGQKELLPQVVGGG